MLIIANNLLAANKEIKSIYVNKFEYMQIDEAQDCSPLQYKIIEKLNKDKYNLAFSEMMTKLSMSFKEVTLSYC